jgi:hypothetical protein
MVIERRKKMSLTCQYDQVNSLNYLGDLVRQVAVEAKLRIPDNYPKVATIKGGEFNTVAPALSVNAGVLTINGRLNPHLVYLTEPVVVAAEESDALSPAFSLLPQATNESANVSTSKTAITFLTVIDFFIMFFPLLIICICCSKNLQVFID